uniref:Uncharacterized protein n=1 Tax=Romanomermis culicivorax TaxID=13658 RepID=A0A915JWT0_ROMCU
MIKLLALVDLRSYVNMRSKVPRYAEVITFWVTLFNMRHIFGVERKSDDFLNKQGIMKVLLKDYDRTVVPNVNNSVVQAFVEITIQASSLMNCNILVNFTMLK